MVCLIYKHELIPCWVKLLQSIPRRYALDRGDGDVCCTRGAAVAHLDVHVFVRVGKGAVAGSLLYQFAAVGEDEGLGGITNGRYTVNQMGEDDCFAGACCQGHTETLMASLQVGKDSLNAFFLVLAQLYLWRRNG